MFDIAYEAEAAICAARKEKERLWKIIFSSDLKRPFACFREMLDMEFYERFIVYYSIMFGTHGGC